MKSWIRSGHLWSLHWALGVHGGSSVHTVPVTLTRMTSTGCMAYRELGLLRGEGLFWFHVSIRQRGFMIQRRFRRYSLTSRPCEKFLLDDLCHTQPRPRNVIISENTMTGEFSMQHLDPPT